ncbi:MAG TPA: dethiobiotin synthase, partial [Pirellulaceae bacterium]
MTGTCTGVGKTYVACRIAEALTRGGTRVGVYKPAASGARWTGTAWIWDDVESLWNAAGRPLDRDAVCPQRFRAACAPYLAAKAE